MNIHTYTNKHTHIHNTRTGPRAKAAAEIAGSTLTAVMTVGHGITDAAHHLLDHGLKVSVVHASKERWGLKAGDAAEKSVSSVCMYVCIYACI